MTKAQKTSRSETKAYQDNERHKLSVKSSASDTQATNSQRETDEEKLIRERLLEGAYHLPGNNYRQDLYQYLINNHPLFGICFSHPLHPVGPGLRALTLLGSVAFGLAITNVIYILFVIDDKNYNASYYELEIGHNITGNAVIDNNVTTINVTNGMIALWTIGAAINALYDTTVWTIATCACFLPGGRFEGKQRYRMYIIMLIALAAVVGATLTVLIQATINSNKQDQLKADTIHVQYTQGAESYRFLIAYSVELVLSLFAWYFIVGTLLFSGILGCFRIPVLGGRPYEVKQCEGEKSEQDVDAV